MTSKVLTIVRLDNAAIGATKSVVMPISNPIATSTSVLHEDWVQTVGSLDAFVAGDEFTMTVTEKQRNPCHHHSDVSGAGWRYRR
ncbi:MAG: hypothetical protein R3C17_10235 [Planctomycetaceae bacterium]